MLVLKELRTNSKRRGYILIALTFALLGLVGVVGLALDMGQAYIAKNEAQTFVDSMALTAAIRLNGDRSGVVAAEQAVISAAANGPIRWGLGTKGFPAVDSDQPLDTTPNTWIRFSSSTLNPNTWLTAANVQTPAGAVTVPGGPANPVPIDRVQVRVRLGLPLTLLQVVPGLAGKQTGVFAYATAIRSGVAGGYPANTNVIPLSPTSHKAVYDALGATVPNTSQSDPNDPNGMRVGQFYTLFWDKDKSTNCAGDSGDPTVLGYVQDYAGDWRGSVCQGASVCREALDHDGIDIAIGTGEIQIPTKEGQASSIVHASDDRIESDTDDDSYYYWGDHNSYLGNGSGNGRRVVIAPINDGVVTGNGSNSYTTVVGFGAFLMETATDKNSGPICGQYLGTVIPGQPFSGGVSPGGNPGAPGPYLVVRLAQ